MVLPDMPLEGRSRFLADCHHIPRLIPHGDAVRPGQQRCEHRSNRQSISLEFYPLRIVTSLQTYCDYLVSDRATRTF